ncbi:MAG: DUF433 domain-containing protein [Chloroflexi bacterium]|nr:DUF433 domain-containing protein [Chloroflexota bacterium]
MAEETNVKTVERETTVDREEYDGVKFHTLAPGITTHPLIRSGKPCIQGTGLKVTDIVALQTFHDMKPPDIANHYEIDLAQVNDALNYYAAHIDYIDTDIKLDSLNDVQLSEAQYGTRPDSILSRRKPVP